MTQGLKLDRIDIKILAELQRNGRISNLDLAEKVALSPSPCLTRVKKLQRAGYISGYAALINLAKLGEVMTVFTEFTLKNHRQTDFGRFEAALAQTDSCTECHLISGGYDYLAKFVVAGVAQYQTTIEHLIDQQIGIDRYFSYVVIKSPFMKQQLALDRLFAEKF